MDKKALEKKRVTELYKKYDLNENDVYSHKNYLIITRSGIEKIQAKSKITITFEDVCVNPDGTYACFKAIATKGKEVLESYGSAKRGGSDYVDVPGQQKKKYVEYGNTNSWYIAEMAEKRAKSRVVLQMEGLYKEGIFGEDENDDFKDKKVATGVSSEPEVEEIDEAPTATKKEPAKKPPTKKVDVPKPEVSEKPEGNKDSHPPEEAIATLEACTTIAELIAAWDVCRGWGFASHPAIIEKKNELKIKLAANE